MTQYYLADAATKKRFGPLSQDQIMNFITTNQLNIKNVFIYMQDLGRWVPFLETGMYKATKSSAKVEDRRLHQRLDIGLAPRLVEIRKLSGDLFYATSSIPS